MALKCEDLRRLLDQEASLDTAVARDHLAGCPDCRAVVDRWTRVEARLEEIGEETPPPFLHGRVMAHVRSERSAPRRYWWAPALAAALLVVGIGVWRAPFDPSDLPTPVVPAPSSLSASATPLPSAVPAVRPPVVSPGPLRGIPTPGAEGSIVCVLVRSDGESRPVILPEAWAPAREAEWAIVVAESGEVSPDGEVGDVPFESLELLAASKLRPGRYLLRRAERAAR